MKKIVSFFVIGLILMTNVAFATELSGLLSIEERYFTGDPLYGNQKQNYGSLVLQPELYYEWENGNSFTFVPFVRIDQVDDERTHLDIRELTAIVLGDEWELRLGVRKVFWGTVESNHLVDIINQTDLVESPDLEEKLGQPMINLSIEKDWGTVDFFLLPYFRERTFPGVNGRLRGNPFIDVNNTEYESSRGKHQIDTAVRYIHSIGEWEIGLSHFRGTSRQPSIVANITNGKLTLHPRYDLITQTGVDLQLIVDDWLLKFEGINRDGQNDDSFSAAVGGFEYTVLGFFGTGADLGILGELIYDSRGEMESPMENDFLAAFRLAANDLASTTALLGVVQDMKNGSKFIFTEASRRIGESWILNLEVNAFIDIETTDLLFGQRDDDFVQLEFSYYY